MKQLLLVAVLCVVGALTPEEDFDANLKAALVLIDETTATLKQAKDADGERVAAAKMKAANGKLADLKKKDEATFRLALEEYSKLRIKYGKKFAVALWELDAESLRCRQQFGLGSPLTQEIDEFKDASAKMHVINEAKASAALVQIAAIDKAIAAYKIKHGAFPSSLNELTQGKTAFLKEKELWGPWELPYCYDASGLVNRGKKPDVWTETPSKERIGNWPNER